MKDMKETKKIIDEIKKKDLSAVEIENIFSALCNQKNFVGGKIWTMDDVKDQVYYSIDENEPRKSIIYSKAVNLPRLKPRASLALRLKRSRGRNDDSLSLHAIYPNWFPWFVD